MPQRLEALGLGDLWTVKFAVGADALWAELAAAMFKKLAFTKNQISAMAALVDVDKITHEDAAKKWLADNEAVWKAFTK